MANRFPLIVNSSALQIQELAASDNLDLASSGIVNASSIGSTTLNITGIATFGGNVSIAGTLTYEDVTNVDSLGIITARTGVRVDAGGLVVTAGVSTFSGITTFTTSVFGTNASLTGVITATEYDIVGSTNTLSAGGLSVGISTANDTRLQSVGEKSTIVNGNTASLVYNTGGGNITICTNPSGDVTLEVTGIPTASSFDNHVITFSVVVQQTGTARTCTAVTLNGVSRTIKFAGGSLASAIAGVTTTTGYDIFSFTGINTIGSASTAANYQVLGVVNGGFA